MEPSCGTQPRCGPVSFIAPSPTPRLSVRAARLPVPRHLAGLRPHRTLLHLTASPSRCPRRVAVAFSTRPDSFKDMQMRLSRTEDGFRIFFSVLFWMGLFFWASALDGWDDGGPRKPSKFKR